MEPIAIYRESAPGLRRNFKLYSDHITVYAKTFGGDEKEVHIPLDELSARSGFVRFRVRRWFGGLFLSFILALFTWIFVSEFKLEWKSPRVVIASSLCLISFGWGVYNLRRYRAYRFVNRSGIAVLDVIEHGPEKNQCANFVAFIEQAIRDTAGNSRNSEQSSSSQSSSKPFLNG